MPVGATQIAALWLSGYAAGVFPRARVALMLGGIGVALAGTVMMYAIPEEVKLGRLLGYYLVPGFSATYVLSLGMVQANVAGRTKKGVVTAALFVGYCVGNLVGPQLFLSSEAPRYESGFVAMIVCFAVQAVVLVLYWLACNADNRKVGLLSLLTRRMRVLIMLVCAARPGTWPAGRGSF